MKFNKSNLDKKWVYYSIATCSAVLLYFGLSHVGTVFSAIRKLFNILSPILTGAVIAYILNPMVEWYDKKVLKKVPAEKQRYQFSVILALVTVFFIVFILVYKLVPQIVESIGTLIMNMRSYIFMVNRFMSRLESLASNAQIDISFITEMSNNLLKTITSKVPSTMDGILTTSVNIGVNVFNIVIGFILAVYFLFDRDRILIGVRDFFSIVLPEETFQSSVNFWKRCNTILIAYIGCSLLDAVIVGIVNGLFMTISGMPYVVLISVIVAITNLAPTFGPFIGAVFGGFILVLINPWYCIWFLVFTMILQTIDGYIIKPKLFGNGLGVSGVWILITIVVGGRMFGVLGIVFAIPIAAIIDFVYRDIVRLLLEKRKSEGNKEKAPDKREKNQVANEADLSEIKQDN